MENCKFFLIFPSQFKHFWIVNNQKKNCWTINEKKFNFLTTTTIIMFTRKIFTIYSVLDNNNWNTENKKLFTIHKHTNHSVDETFPKTESNQTSQKKKINYLLYNNINKSSQFFIKFFLALQDFRHTACVS